MRVAFVGKGGSGKTTMSAAFSRHLAARGLPVLAFDADINQHLAQALGRLGPLPHALGTDLPWLKEYLRGTNPRITSAEAMIKTTPPGAGHGWSASPTTISCWPATRRMSTGCGSWSAGR